jgi:hypothetical protein
MVNLCLGKHGRQVIGGPCLLGGNQEQLRFDALAPLRDLDFDLGPGPRRPSPVSRGN